MENNNYKNNFQNRGGGGFSEYVKIPIFERKEISHWTISKYPEYQWLFYPCPSCGRRSLKPVGYKKMSPLHIKNNADTLDRTCSSCGYLHRPVK